MASTRPLLARASPSLSRAEVSHFNTLHPSAWDEASGAFTLLHRMNPLRVHFLRQRLRSDPSPAFPRPASSLRFLSNLSVLDLGCGAGIFSQLLARLGAKVLAADVSTEAIKVATAHHQQQLDRQPRSHLHDSSSLDFQLASVEHLASQPHLQNSFDVVCAMEVIEHVHDPVSFLKSVAQLTTPGGHIILSTIAKTPLSKFLAITLAESSLPLVGSVPPGTHSHSKFISPPQLSHIFNHHLCWNLNQERYNLEARGAFYNPFSTTWSLFPRDAPATLWCNYFFGVKKPFNC